MSAQLRTQKRLSFHFSAFNRKIYIWRAAPKRFLKPIVCLRKHWPRARFFVEHACRICFCFFGITEHEQQLLAMNNVAGIDKRRGRSTEPLREALNASPAFSMKFRVKITCRIFGTIWWPILSASGAKVGQQNNPFWSSNDSFWDSSGASKWLSVRANCSEFFLRDIFSSRKKRRCFFRDMLRHGQTVSEHSLGNEILFKTSERLEHWIAAPLRFLN